MIRDLLRRVRGAGIGVAAGTWEREFAARAWDRLERAAERPRYEVVAGTLRRLKPGGAYLDVGCGQGLLLDHLGPDGYRRYVGIDLSATAIREAGPRAGAAATLVVADALVYEPDERFDAIVFNEVLYYPDDPAAVARRYRRHLAPGGVIVVSMMRTIRTRAIWRRLARDWRVLDETTIPNREGQAWLCKVLEPRG